jgi:putative transposase
MKPVLTLVCKLQPTDEPAQHLDTTLTRFADACTDIHTTLPPGIRHKDYIQAMLYHDVRSGFQLSATLGIQAIRRVAMNRKAAHKTGSAVPSFTATSLQDDARICSCRERDWTISLALVHRRARLRLRLGTFQCGKLKGQKPKAAQRCKHRDGSFAVHSQLPIPIETPPGPEQAIGVDLRRHAMAHTGTGPSWAGAHTTCLRDRYARVRRGLQQKASEDTTSARRCRHLLARLSGRAKRCQRPTNHIISQALGEEATARQATLGMKDLTSNQERINQQPRPKRARRHSNSGAFSQLWDFVQDKAALAAVLLAVCPPASTSQMCHACRPCCHRHGTRLTCTHPRCGWCGDADGHAAQNIVMMGLPLTRPRGPWLYTP